jgi:hypothetical protein
MSLYHYKLTTSDPWREKYEAAIGKDALAAYIARVKKLLDGMKERTKFSVLTGVESENHELFIKIACEFIDVSRMSRSGKNYEFSDDFTEFRRREDMFGKVKTLDRGWYNKD